MNDQNNSCIYSDIVTPLDTIRVFNAHIGSIRFKEEDYALFDQSGDGDTKKSVGRVLRLLKRAYVKRSKQVDRIAEAIKASPYPVILCGDLNDTPVSYCYAVLNELLEDAFVNSGWGIGRTYVGVVPSNRIDYIFYSKEYVSSSFNVHDLNVSDHKPISSYIGRE